METGNRNMTMSFDKSTQFTAIAGNNDVAGMINSFLASKANSLAQAPETQGFQHGVSAGQAATESKGIA